MKRVLSVYLPYLPTDRLRKSDEAACGTVATMAPVGQVLRLVHVNAAARRDRLRSGQTLADARAMVPGLATFDDDPEADRRALESLALWANRFSPIVHIEDDQTLFVDVTGCRRLFDGEDNLLRQAAEGLKEQGFAARCAIADTPGAAWALARAHPDDRSIAQPGQTAADLAPLPVWSLRVERKTVDMLASLGVRTIASLLYLPRSSLSCRFGQSLLDRLDQAMGDLPEVLSPYHPMPAVSGSVTFGAATTRLDVLREGLRESVGRFCQELDKRVAGVRRALVTFSCPAISRSDTACSVTLPVHLSQATRSSEHLFALMVVMLGGLRLPAPADAITVWSQEAEHLDGWQDELFSTDAGNERELGDLVDRLAVRLSTNAVARPRLLSEHQPECAFCYEPIADSGPKRSGHGHKSGRQESARAHHRITRPPRTRLRKNTARGAQAVVGESVVGGLRPLRVMPRPVEIAATALMPEGPPISFRWREAWPRESPHGHSRYGGSRNGDSNYGDSRNREPGRGDSRNRGSPNRRSPDGGCHMVAHTIGPERIETGWWRGRHIRRDYYRVITDQGRHCWIFRNRDTGRWFLHGWFE